MYLEEPFLQTSSHMTNWSLLTLHLFLILLSKRWRCENVMFMKEFENRAGEKCFGCWIDGIQRELLCFCWQFIYIDVIKFDMSSFKVCVCVCALRHLRWHSTKINRFIRIDVLISLYCRLRKSFYIEITVGKIFFRVVIYLNLVIVLL